VRASVTVWEFRCFSFRGRLFHFSRTAVSVSKNGCFSLQERLFHFTRTGVSVCKNRCYNFNDENKAVTLQDGQQYRNRHWESFIDLDWHIVGYIRYPLNISIEDITTGDTRSSVEIKALIRFLLSCDYYQLKTAETFLQKVIEFRKSGKKIARTDLSLDEFLLVPQIYDNFITVSPVEEMNLLDDFYHEILGLVK
jgi:hypothetical protein